MADDVQRWVSEWLDHQDEAAARALMAALHPQVAAIVRRHLPYRMAPEDLTQEVFVRLFRQLHRYDPGRPLENWVSRVTLNVCRDHLRARASRPELRWTDLTPGEQHAFESAAFESDASATAAEADARALLLKILETLSADDRMIVTLLHLEERTVDEIAALTGWSRTLVKVRAFRARGRLRKALAALEARNSAAGP